MAFAGSGTAVAGGHNTKHSLKMESAIGTATGNELWLGTITNFTCRRVDAVHYRKGLNARSNWDGVSLLNRRYEGTIAGEVNNGVPYALALGAIHATTDPTIGSLRGYEHLDDSGSNKFDGFTKLVLPTFTFVTEDSSGETKGVKGATVTGATFTFTKDGINTFSLDYVAQAEDTTDITGATSVTDVYGYHNTKIQYDDAVPFDAAVTDGITGWTELTVTITPDLEIENEINAATIRQPRFKRMALSWSLTRYAQDDDFWNPTDFATTDSKSFRIYQYVGAASVLSTDLQGSILNDVESGVDQDGITMERMNFGVRDVVVTVLDGTNAYLEWD